MLFDSPRLFRVIYALRSGAPAPVSFDLILQYIQYLTESLEMYNLALAQELYHIGYIGIIAYPQYIVIGSSCLLLCRKILMQIRKRVSLALQVRRCKRNSARIGRIYRICVIHIIRAYTVPVKAFRSLTRCQLRNYRTDHFQMRKFFSPSLLPEMIPYRL